MNDLTPKFSRSYFPDPLTADESGIVAAGGEMTLDLLADAYYHGIFPWPHEEYPLLWFFPFERGVLQFKNLHVSQSLKKYMRQHKFEFRMNSEFSKVVDFCGSVPRKDQEGTWINEEIKKNYLAFHKAGYAHSFELFEQKELVAGLYGVYVEGAFSGESIFGLKDNVSKVCFLKTVEFLQSKGLKWMDVQMITSLTKSFGAELIDRKSYLSMLRKVHEQVKTKALVKAL